MGNTSVLWTEHATLHFFFLKTRRAEVKPVLPNQSGQFDNARDLLEAIHRRDDLLPFFLIEELFGQRMKFSQDLLRGCWIFWIPLWKVHVRLKNSAIL